MVAEVAESVKKGPKLTIKEVAGRLDRVVDSTNDAMEVLKEQNKSILSMLAKNNPVTITPSMDATGQDLGEVPDIGDSPIVTGIFDINSPEFQEKESIERFMREKVKIRIHESNNDLEVDTFFASVNNKPVLFRFGETKVVPRYIVETLARAKPITYSNTERVNRDNVKYVENKGRCGLRYPFEVIEDTSVGRSWLNRVLAQQ